MDMKRYLLERTEIKSKNECWPWKLSTGSHGYGQGWNGETIKLAHRMTYEAFVGKIPPDMTVDHKCHVLICQNPRHLRLKTNIDNASDNGQISKTHCPHNHPYSGKNLYLDPKGYRRCRECATELRKKKRKVDTCPIVM